MSSISPLVYSNPSEEAFRASWAFTCATVFYTSIETTILTASIALIFFTALANPIFGVILSVAFIQKKTIEKIDSLTLAPLRPNIILARATDEIAQRILKKSNDREGTSHDETKKIIENYLNAPLEKREYFAHFSKACGENTLTRLKPLLAKIEGWDEAAHLAKDKIEKLLIESDSQIEIAKKPGLSNSEMVSALSIAAELRNEAYEIEKTTFLPARLQAAYHLGVLGNIYYKKSFKENGEFFPMNLSTRALLTSDIAHSHRFPDIIYKTTSGITLTRQQVAMLPLHELSSLLLS